MKRADRGQPSAAGAFTIDRPKFTPEDEKKLMAAQRNNKVSERKIVAMGERNGSVVGSA